MAKHKTEKRKAIVGERILITNAEHAIASYKNGDVFTVNSVGFGGVTGYTTPIIWHHEYEVIVGEHTPAPNLDEMDYNELITLSEAVMKALRTRSYKNGYDQGRFDAEIEAPKSDQQKRDEIVAQAKEDVRRLLESDYGHDHEFIVNSAKRAVVYLREVAGRTSVGLRGVAKCSPNDCFNAHIGKAIALRRSLRLPVPTEYLNVPQPTDVRVGDVVESTGWAGHKRKFAVQRIENGRVYGEQPWLYVHLDEASRFGFLATDPKIVDDSRAGEGA
ncbi:hypothetical protein [Bacillus safensis]|uniref:hypothetical protein n=1 Tax=Bacillus safensis TaxID=561879 RepID=UPI002E208C14|nr:hypothetical protein [Bacillus safensis]